MIDEKLIAYVKQKLAQNVSEENIRLALLSAKWVENDIQQAFQLIKSGQADPIKGILFLGLSKYQIRKMVIIFIICSLVLSSYIFPVFFFLISPSERDFFIPIVTLPAILASVLASYVVAKNTMPRTGISRALYGIRDVLAAFILTLIIYGGLCAVLCEVLNINT